MSIDDRCKTKKFTQSKLILLMSVLLMLFGSFFFIEKAEASKLKVSGDWEYYDLSSGGVAIANYRGTSKHVVIPETLGGKPVTTIAGKNFTENPYSHQFGPFEGKRIESVVLPNNLEFIGNDAFRNNNLTKVVIPEGVDFIHNGAFENNKLKEVYVLGTNTKVMNDNLLESDSPFYGNANDLKIITPNGVKSYYEEYPPWYFIEDIERHANRIGVNVVKGGVEQINFSFSANGSSTYKKSHSTRVTASGYGFDSSKPVQYVWSTSTSRPSSGWKTFTNGNTISRSSGTGNYYLHVRGTNYMGNYVYARTNVFRMDNTAPSLTLSRSTSNPTNGNVTITATGSDSHSGVKRIRRPNGTWVNGSSTTYSVSSNGTYSFTVEDNAGNQRTQSITISNIDKTAPSVSLSKNGGSWARSHSTTINASDSGSGLSKVEYRWTTSSSFPTSGFTSGANGTTTSAPTSTGNHYLHVKATDKAGNVTEFTSSVFRIDRTAPTGSISLSTTSPTNQNVTLTATGSDSHSGVKRIQKPDGTWVTGSSATHTVSSNGTYKFVVEDNAGNTRTVEKTVSNIDKTKPTISLSKDGGSWARSHSATINASDSGSGVNKVEYAWTTSTSFPKSGFTTIDNGKSVSAPTSTGNKYLHVKVTDKAGNVTQFTSKVFRIDRTTPSVSVSASTTSPTNQNVTLTATGSDSHSGVKRIQKPDGTWVNGSSTTHVVSSNGTYSFVVEDNVGNTKTQSITVSNIDKTPPANATFSQNVTTWTNGNVSVTVNFPSDAKVKQYRKDNGSWTNYSSAVSFSANGKLEARSQDEAGNWSNVTTHNVTNIDKTAPTLSLKASTTAPTNQNVVVTVTRSDNASGIAEVKWGSGNRNADWFATNGTALSGNTFTVSSNGTYTAFVKDKAGNVKVQTININNIDKTPPANATFTPSTTAWTNGNVSVTVNYPSDAKVKQYRKDGGSWTSYSSAVTFTANGKIEARSQDEAGNWSKVTTYNVTNIDKVNPSLNLTPSTTAPTNQNVEVSVSRSDAASGIKEVKWATGERNAAWMAENGTNLNGNSFTAKDNGVYTVFVKDNAGNVTVKTITVSNIDRVPPVPATFTPSETKPTNKNVTVAINFPNDAHVKQYRLGTSGEWKAYSSSIEFEENGTIQARSQDNAGNWSNVATYNVENIDKVAPVKPNLTASTTKWTNKDVIVSISFPSDAYIKEYRIDGKEWKTYSNALTLSANATVEARAHDEAGNISEVAKFVVDNIDKVNPTLSLQASTTAPTNQNVTITTTPADKASGIEVVKWLKGNHNTAKVLADGETVENNRFIAKDNGVYTVAVRDVAGNTISKQIEVSNIDRIAPIKATFNVSTDKWVNKDVIVTPIFPEDAHIQEVRVNDGEWVAYEKAITFTVNGTLEARSRDEAGNWSDVSRYVVDNIDKVKPELKLTITNPEPTNQNVIISAVATDKDSGIKVTKWVAGEGNVNEVLENGKVVENNRFVAEENGVYTVVTLDVAGNTTLETINVSNIDRIAPVDTTFTPSITEWTNESVTVEMNYADDAFIKQVRVNGKDWEVYEKAIVFDENGYVEARSRDEAGNWSNVTRYNVENIDLVNPELSLEASTTKPTNKDVIIEVTANDADSGINDMFWIIGDHKAEDILKDGEAVKDNKVTATINGVYSVVVIDNAGNTTVKKITVSNIDRIPPVAAILTADEEYWINENVTVSIEYPTDAHIKEIKVGEGEWKLYDGDVVFTENGTLHARSWDEAGNVSEVATIHVTNIDKVDPTLTLTPEITEPTNEDFSIEVIAKDDYSGIHEVKWLAGSHNADKLSKDGTIVKNGSFIVTENGVYSVLVKDNAGNAIVKEIEVKNIDKIAPEAPKVTVVENENHFSLVHGEDEGLGTSHSLYRVNNGDWKVYEGEIYLTDGDYTFEVKTIDRAGNESEIVTIQVTFYYEYLTNLEDSFDEFEDFFPIEDLDDIRDAIDNLPPNAEEREELEERYERAEKIANGETDGIMSPEASVTWKLILAIDGYDRFWAGLNAVEKRFAEVSEDDEFYEMLANNVERLRNNLANYFQELRKDQDINNAFNRVEDVEERYSATREQMARTAIEKLQDEELQLHLKERLEEAIQAYQDAEAVAAIDNAIELVEKAEASPSMVNMKLARSAVEELQDGELKDELTARLDALIPEKEEPTEEELLQQQIDEAIALVEKAEENYTTVNRIMATNAVNALPDSDIKTELLERLFILENPPVDKEAEALNQATEAMENAERYRTRHYVELAHEAIYELVDSEAKDELIERLDTLKEALGLDDKGLFEKAISEIDRHLRSPRITIYKNRALNAIADVINEEHRESLEAYMAGEITKDELWEAFENEDQPEEEPVEENEGSEEE